MIVGQCHSRMPGHGHSKEIRKDEMAVPGTKGPKHRPVEAKPNAEPALAPAPESEAEFQVELRREESRFEVGSW